MAQSQPQKPPSKSLKDFVLREITDPSYAYQLAQTHWAAFRNNLLNTTMYPMDNETVMVAWGAERLRREMLKGNQAFIVLIDPCTSPEGGNGEDGAREKIIALSRWIIPGRINSTHPVNGIKPMKEGNDNERQTHITGSQPRTEQVSPPSSAVLSQPEVVPSAATITPASEAEKLSQPYNIPPLPEGSNLGLVTEFREILAHYRKIMFDDVKDKEAVCFLGSLATDPSYQGLGCASALLNWGIQQAESINAKIYLESSPDALNVYLKHGWQVVATAYNDLKKYGGPDVMYPLTMMVREPKKSVASST